MSENTHNLHMHVARSAEVRDYTFHRGRQSNWCIHQEKSSYTILKMNSSTHDSFNSCCLFFIKFNPPPKGSSSAPFDLREVGNPLFVTAVAASSA